jgi:hypothetical protein
MRGRRLNTGVPGFEGEVMTHRRDHLIAAIIVAFLCLSVSAEARSVRVGVRGGWNFASLHGGDASHYESKVCPNFGIFGFFPVARHLAIQPEFRPSLIEDWDYSFVFGGAFGIPVGGGLLGLDLRFDPGLTSIYNDMVDEKLENRVFSVLIGYSH